MSPVPTITSAFDQARSDYAAAKRSRYKRVRTGLDPHGSGADYHYLGGLDYWRMLEDARDMDRNDPAVSPLINRACDNTVQSGFALDPQTGDKGLDGELWARWQEWTTTPDLCDLTGESTFAELEWLTFRNMLVDGDIFVLPLENGALQTIEAHRVRTPTNTKLNVVHGVHLNQLRQPLEYWITKEDIGLRHAIRKVGEVTKYPARDAAGHKQVFHLLQLRRKSQTRGVTALHPVCDVAGMFDDINFAKMVQQQVVSCFAIFHELELGADPLIPSVTGATTADTYRDGGSRETQGVAPGMRIRGRPGEKLTGFSPNVPNQEFFAHVKLLLTLMSINLGLPLALALLDPSETNFSGWRGALDQAKLGFRRNQATLRDRLHVPTYRWKVRQWGADDPAIAKAIQSNPQVFNHLWKLPTWPYIEPLKDASAQLLRQRNGLSSPRQIQSENGREWETVADEIVADNAYAIRQAKQQAAAINQEFPDDESVHWRELISLPTPDGIQLALGASDAGRGARDE